MKGVIKKTDNWKKTGKHTWLALLLALPGLFTGILFDTSYVGILAFHNGLEPDV